MTAKTPARGFWIVLLVFAGAVLALQSAARADDPAHFVGGEICAACHAAETARWKESHHAQAMQAATPATVLGDFADAKLNHFGVVTTFSRAGDKFMVRTDGPDGALHDGQRWLHLYPDQRLPAGDRLHWTGRDQTWNYMCADCHSTDVKKNYDLTTNTYATTWTDVNAFAITLHREWHAEQASSSPEASGSVRLAIPVSRFISQ